MERDDTRLILKHRKPICPYICSTMNDFQEERDFLATNVFPQLNELCNSRGTYFKAVDLRWSAVKSLKPFPDNLFRQYSCLHSQHLKLCLDYVNSCFPFFICLLGQTYGEFLPDYTPFLFSKATDLASLSREEQNLYVAAKNGYPWVLETPNCSLIEFEIIQAAFRKQSQFQYFYFRTGTRILKSFEEEEEEPLVSGSLVDEEEKLKIGKLKAKIISKGLHVRFYKELHELGELVLKDWLVVIETLYPFSVITENTDYKHSFERFYHDEFIEKCKQVFVISKEANRIFNILEKFALKDMELEPNSSASASNLDSVLRINSFPAYKSILLLSGERGCGKSTLIASWVDSFKNKCPNILMIPYFVGSTSESSDIMSVIHYFITELQHKNYGTHLEMDFLSEDSNVLVFSLLVEMFIASISLKPCILVLDGIEELIGIYGISSQKAKEFSWLPNSLPPHCKFILSTTSSSLSFKSLCARSDVRTIELSSIGDEDTKLSIFKQHLSMPNQDSFWQNKQIWRKKTNLSPLKLTILANELKECRVYRNEFQCMREYLEVTSIQELWELILKRWIEDYSWTSNQKKTNSSTVAIEGLDSWLSDALCLLCIAHCGLAEDELLHLLELLGYRNHYRVTMVHWAAFRNATKYWIQEKPNGLLYFRHQTLRNAVEHKLLGVIIPVRESSPYTFLNPTNQKKTHFHQILTRFFQRKTGFWRVYQELPWHLKMSGCWAGLCGFLTSPSITDFISKIQSPSLWTRLHFIHYWNVLLEAGYDASAAYMLSVDKIKADQCHKIKKRCTLSVLECRLLRINDTDKCRLILFIGSFLKYMGKTKEAEELFLSVEDMLMQRPSTRGMLLQAQNAVGELYLEIGMIQKGFKYFQKAWSNLLFYSLKDLKASQYLMKQKVKVLNNLAKSASEEFLKENHILDYATEVAKIVISNPCDQATMKYTEGVLMLADGNITLAKVKFQECLYIRRSLFGEKNMLVGETMEFLADLLFFLQKDPEKSQKKQATEYYKQVIKIKEDADTLASSSLVKKQLSISLSDTLCKLAGQLLANDFSHHATTEAVGYLYRSLDLRATYLGSSHPSIPGILHLLRELERTRGKRFWPQGKSQQSHEGSKHGSSMWEHLYELNYHSAQNFTTVSSAMFTSIGKLQKAERMELAAALISDTQKCASSKGKKILRRMRCISADEKIQQKSQKNAGILNSPRRETSKKKKDCSFNIFNADKTNCVVRLSKQRISSGGSESGERQITIYQHSSPLSTNNPWESISELISEKWLFHSPDYSLSPQKSVSQRRSQIET
ncbi:putative tetratricopeptide repeat protein 41 [Perognathus longimembris pacificus]|uniref:putative tetratricopeptide repeat protein 41 n=1 Tax=Perognathus longimembris pacificus TaxID=214514 RepID=UPI002018B939|nr:putative tetratricopeptide repeat protein 41 [Perognathus longimembris pacificus]XP_048212970.1 putative tetratricopeptide repeat protein 41 [Perognathus longimembris pacificus]